MRSKKVAPASVKEEKYEVGTMGCLDPHSLLISALWTLKEGSNR